MYLIVCTGRLIVDVFLCALVNYCFCFSFVFLPGAVVDYGFTSGGKGMLGDVGSSVQVG